MADPNRCPSCGERVTAFAAGCSSCGAEIVRVRGRAVLKSESHKSRLRRQFDDFLGHLGGDRRPEPEAVARERR